MDAGHLHHGGQQEGHAQRQAADALHAEQPVEVGRGVRIRDMEDKVIFEAKSKESPDRRERQMKHHHKNS